MTDAVPAPELGRSRWLVRVGVYVMLVASAGAALLFSDRLWSAARLGSLPVWTALLPPVTFTAFVAVYAVDRWLLVRKRGYSLTRAFFQLALAVLFLTLLWPQQAQELRRTRASQGLGAAARLLFHKDAEVRAAACELAMFKTDFGALPRIEDLAAHDGHEPVRAACTTSAERLRALGGQ